MNNFSPLKIIIGLGNPGPGYEITRHNAGFMVIDELSLRHGFGKWEKGSWSLLQRANFGQAGAILAKPQTYVNRSGAAVAALLDSFGLGPGDLVVVHDDLDIALGRVKLKTKGGDCGHKGVGSTIETLGTGQFIRIRVGIGRPGAGVDVTDHVLGPFTELEAELIGSSIAKAADRVQEVFRCLARDKGVGPLTRQGGGQL